MLIDSFAYVNDATFSEITLTLMINIIFQFFIISCGFKFIDYRIN